MDLNSFDFFLKTWEICLKITEENVVCERRPIFFLGLIFLASLAELIIRPFLAYPRTAFGSGWSFLPQMTTKNPSSLNSLASFWFLITLGQVVSIDFSFKLFNY